MIKIIIILSILTFSYTLSAQTKVTIYGDDSYPPYSFLDSDRLTGVYTIILERIFEQMPDYKVELKGKDWKQGLVQIQRGFIFALYPPYKRADRPYMEFEMPILEEEVVVYCRKEVLEEARPNWPEDYYGLTIGNNSGFSVGGAKFSEAVKSGKIKVKETKGTPRSLLQLINGKVDCYMNDVVSIQWELKKLRKEGRYSGTNLERSIVISREYAYLGFSTSGSRYPFKKDFKKQYFNILTKMKKSGEIDSIVKRFPEKNTQV
ncbi:MAG: polar amino acid transport system substrate-binding protein [Oleiphilaceae bacterium]|jgi:polar amino acid transport system substrate-binding protein